MEDKIQKAIYLFSGLGADRRAFQKLDLSGFQAFFIEWIPPYYQETMTEYAIRISQQIKHQNPILIGLSFGGMIAIEVAKIIPTSQVILLASAKTFLEIPFYFRYIGKLGLHSLIPLKFFKKANFLTYWFFGVRENEDKKNLQSILRNTDGIFLQWAIHQILNWRNTIIPNHITHIHGSSDKILPIKYIKTDIIIHKGGHLMTLTNAETLNKVIREILID